VATRVPPSRREVVAHVGRIAGVTKVVLFGRQDLAAVWAGDYPPAAFDPHLGLLTRPPARTSPHDHRAAAGPPAGHVMRTWLSIRVELVGGGGRTLWPRPGRVFAAARSHTFLALGDAIDSEEAGPAMTNAVVLPLYFI
jgi:hypothetical protein